LLAGIPFCDYRTYCIKILFPGVEEHPVLQWDRPDLARKEKGLRLFGQLVMNKVRVIKRCRLSLLTTLVYDSKCGGRLRNLSQ
jgi:hypothetical protein